VRLPFAWTGVSLHAAGATALRARLSVDDAGAVSLTAADAAGALVVTVDSLVSRPVTAGDLAPGAGPGAGPGALFTQDWIPVPVPAGGQPHPVSRLAVAGADPLSLAGGLPAAAYPALTDAAEAAQIPDVVLISAVPPYDGLTTAEAARLAAGSVLGLLRRWLADGRLGAARLVVVTRGAVAAGPGDAVTDLAGAAVWGLVRSAQSEEPGRIVLADLSGPQDAGTLTAAVGSGEPELAVRDGVVYRRRLVRPAGGLPASPAEDVPWRLAATGAGTPDDLTLAPHPGAAAPLGPGQVRVAVRAAGLNMRDLLTGAAMTPGEVVMGGEIAAIVMETGPGVPGLAPGDRVLGLADGGIGPVQVTSAQLLARMPEGWSFPRAASVPVSFVTAWYALVDLAQAKAGQRVLVHAAASGAGRAAVAVARHLGLEVYATAPPARHAALARMGLDAAHIASPGMAEFADAFLAATGGTGLDIVLNTFTGELTDASLRLLPHGGQFLEMTATDIRDASGVAREHPGVVYRAFDLSWAGGDRLGEILTQVTALLADGQLALPPVRCWDVRRAPEALRFIAQAGHAGKLVLTVPPGPAASRVPGTVLVTGGTGMLGGLVAGHLAATGRAAGVLLVSRSGPAAAGVAGLAAGIAAGGAGVRVAACDAGDRRALAAVLAGVPLSGVVHAAGVLDDGVISSLTPERVGAVMRPKADAAWHLHELTAGLDLEFFVLFSSAAATLGSAGQGSYCAANAFLDGLAGLRRAAGLPAVSLAWGLWADASAMTGRLTDTDRARITRGGVTGLTAAEGLGLLDIALGRDEATLMPARLDIAGLRAQAAAGTALPMLLHGLTGGPAGIRARRTARAAEAGRDGADALRRRLAALSGTDRLRTLVDLVRDHAAAVLGYAAAERIEASRPFKDMGFDSLTAVELRNRLNAETGLLLPATLLFDSPTLTAAAEYIRAEMIPGDADVQAPIFTELDELESSLSGMAAHREMRDDITRRLQKMLSHWIESHDQEESVDSSIEFRSATPDEVFDFLDKELGSR
jgi:NADPH:quinone reductase-like Zn-dependent oxidoreductase/acyl carrier protein